MVRVNTISWFQGVDGLNFKIFQVKKLRNWLSQLKDKYLNAVKKAIASWLGRIPS